MARYFGKVGYGVEAETAPGVWEVQTVERSYYGDVLKNYSKWDKGELRNDDLRISNRISIVADAYAYEHASAIRYVEWMGARWKVTDLEIERPRMTLTIGGVYHGDET